MSGNDPYERQDRAVLGDELFEACVRAGREAPPPNPEQVALIARIFGPGMRRVAALGPAALATTKQAA